MLRGLARICEKYPFYSGSVISCVKTGVADALVQINIEKRGFEDFDYKRNLAFSSFGLFYLGGVQYSLYVPIFSRIFPRAASFAAKPLAEKVKDPIGISQLFAQVFIDQAMHHPFMYFPCFYFVRELVSNGDPFKAKDVALKKWQDNFWPDLNALWKIWVPAMTVNFAICPLWLRIPFVSATSMLWTCILSYMRGDDDVGLRTKDSSDLLFQQGQVLMQRIQPTAIDHDKDYFTITILATDYRGLIRDVANEVTRAGGNISMSRFSRVLNECAFLVLVEADRGSGGEVQQKLAVALQDSKHEAHDFSTTSKSYYPQDAEKIKRTEKPIFQVILYGKDKPGLVHGISDILSANHCTVESLHCEQTSEATSKNLFIIEMTAMPERDLTPQQEKALEKTVHSFASEHGARAALVFGLR